MTDKKPSSENRIPADSLTEDSNIKSWTIPTVATPKTKKIFTAKREEQQRQKAPGETIEDYKGAVKPKPMTAQDLQQMVQDAQQEGYEKGYQEGLQKGMEDGQAQGQKTGHDSAYKETKLKLETELQSFQQIAAQLLVPMQEQEQALEKIIVDMAVNFAQRLMHREIENVPQSMIAVVEHALQSLPAGAKNVTVYVNPEDAEVIEEHLPEHQRQWQVKVDKNIQRCGCRVETLESVVDYTVEGRLSQFLNHIYEQLVPDLTQVPPVQEYETEIDPELENFQAMKSAVSEFSSSEQTSSQDDEAIESNEDKNIEQFDEQDDQDIDALLGEASPSDAEPEPAKKKAPENLSSRTSGNEDLENKNLENKQRESEKPKTKTQNDEDGETP